MIDFESLNDAGEQQKEQPRHPEAQAEYQMGCAYLINAEAEPDVEHLRDAAESFLAAIEWAPSWAEPYLGLVQVFAMLNNQILAQKYLNAARKVSPRHPRIPEIGQALARCFKTEIKVPQQTSQRLQRVELPNLNRPNFSLKNFRR